MNRKMCLLRICKNSLLLLATTSVGLALHVENRRIVLPDGMSYAALVLPDRIISHRKFSQRLMLWWRTGQR